MALDEVTRAANAGGALATGAADEMCRRGYFKVGDQWVEQHDSGRGSGLAVGRTTALRTRRTQR
jgi:hypothetical protein